MEREEKKEKRLAVFFIFSYYYLGTSFPCSNLEQRYGYIVRGSSITSLYFTFMLNSLLPKPLMHGNSIPWFTIC